MAGGSEAQRLDRALDDVRQIVDPLRRLEAVRLGQERLAAMESAAVRDARSAGATWKAIGALYGLSKQGAQQRFGAPGPGAGGAAG